jgi:hypothetical protein
MDFLPWNTASHYVLWVSGPPDRSIDQVSSHLIRLARNEALKPHHSILYFFCSTAATEKSIIIIFVLTLLYQFVSYSPPRQQKSVIKTFLERLLEEAHKWKPWHLNEEDPQFIAVNKITLKAPVDELWFALEAVLADEGKRELTIIIDGLDKIEHHQSKFIHGVRVLSSACRRKSRRSRLYLQANRKLRSEKYLNDLPCIEYNKERKGSPYATRF